MTFKKQNAEENTCQHSDNVKKKQLSRFVSDDCYTDIMTHPEEELLAYYGAIMLLDGLVALMPSRRTVRSHLKICDQCSQKVSAYRESPSITMAELVLQDQEILLPSSLFQR